LAKAATAKLTVSVKRRLPDGSEVFIAPGIEIMCTQADLDATQTEVTERVNGWVTSLLEVYPDTDPITEAEGKAEEEAEEEAEDETEEEAELTEEDVAAMGKPDLVALVKEHGLEVDTKLPVVKLRAAVVEALFTEDEAEEEAEAEEGEEEGEEIDLASLDDDDATALCNELGIKGKTLAIKRKALEAFADEDKLIEAYEKLFGDEEEGEESGEEEGEEEAFTEEDLTAMTLEELQGIVEEWGIKHPVLPKGSKLSAKKPAYIKALLAAQAG
jgi:hypothetical protein